MVTLTEASARPSTVPSQRGRVRSFFGTHWLITLLLTAGVAVRAAVVYAYWPAFWFQSDSGNYISDAGPLDPGQDPVRALGYPAFLRLLRPFGSLATVAVVQHLLALVLAIGVYRFLRVRGVAGWLAALGCLPLLLDAHQLVLEHYILSDSLFTTLVVGGLALLLWDGRARPPWWACAASGALLASAVLTRPQGLAVLAVVLLYLPVRRVGWARSAALVGVLVVLLGGYLTWVGHETGHYALTRMSGRYLYARTAGIADCSRLRLSAEQRQLCPAQPLGQRPPRSDWYLSFDQNLARYGVERDGFVGSFATAVISQQPADYAALVGRDTARFLAPSSPVDPSTACLFGWWRLPASVPDVVAKEGRCKPLLSRAGPADWRPAEPHSNAHARLRSALAWYAGWAVTPPIVVGLCVLLALIAAVWPPRRGWHGLDAVTLAAAGLGLIVLAMATSMYDIRYGMSATMLLAIAGPLAAHRIATSSRREPTVAAVAPVVPETSAAAPAAPEASAAPADPSLATPEGTSERRY